MLPDLHRGRVREMRWRARTTGLDAAGMRSYALQHTRTLLRRLAFQVNQTARLGDADAVHDLRVAIRRFTQCLRVFEQYFPKAEPRKVRRKLKTIMELAAAVRDRDIAVDLLKASGIPKGATVLAVLTRERKQAEEELLEAIRRSSRDNFSSKWRERLG